MANNSNRRKGRLNSNKGNDKPEDQPTFDYDTHCAKCKELLHDEQISCEICNHWFHKKCSGLSNADFCYLVGTDDSVGWFCPHCRQEKSTTKGLEMKMDEMMTMVRSFGDRLILAESGESPRLREHIQEVVKKEIKTAMEEKDEHDKRMLNLVIVNIPESGKDTMEEKKEHDVERVIEVLKSTGLDAGELKEVTNVFRLGKDQGRTRPIRISVRKLETKDKILQNVRQINTNKNASERVYVNKDLTQNEREEEKILRDELREKRKSNNGRWVIRNQKVVEVSEDRPSALKDN